MLSYIFIYIIWNSFIYWKTTKEQKYKQPNKFEYWFINDNKLSYLYLEEKTLVYRLKIKYNNNKCLCLCLWNFCLKTVLKSYSYLFGETTILVP